MTRDKSGAEFDGLAELAVSRHMMSLGTLVVEVAYANSYRACGMRSDADAVGPLPVLDDGFQFKAPQQEG